MKQIKTIGVLTGGGDCPGLNAVIRAVVKTAINHYGLRVIGFLDGFSGLIHNKTVELDVKSVSGILHRGGTILGTSNRDNPFAFPIEQDGKKVKVDMSQRVMANLQTNGVDCLVVIGGDGSLSIALELFNLGVPTIGVPKTIDNDLFATDYTFGFDTALTTAMEAIDKLHTTAESHHRVMVLEVMGRYAGWIALHGGIAGGADVILIPEIPYNINEVCQKILERQHAGKFFSIVVVAEGAKPLDGKMVVAKVIEDSADPIRLGGIGNKVSKEIEEVTGLESRVTVLGHLQRGGTPSAFDRILATRFGSAAVDLLMSGGFGRTVCLNGTEVASVSLEEATHKLKLVDPRGEIVDAAKKVGISFGG